VLLKEKIIAEARKVLGERRVRKFKEARLERKEIVVEMERKRMEGMPLRRSRSRRVCKDRTGRGCAGELEYV
jgi:hypothetical protein